MTTAPSRPAFPSTVVFPFTGRNVGGSHISTFTLAQALSREFNVRIVAAVAPDTPVEREARRFGLEVLTTSSTVLTHRPAARDLTRSPQRARLLASFGSNAVLHCNDVWSLQSWLPAAKLRRLPIVYHHRAFEHPTQLNRLLIGTAEALISISEACTSDLQRIVSKPIRTVTNPFSTLQSGDLAFRRETLKETWPDVEDVRYVGFVANLQSRKRPAFFLDVAAALAPRFPQARFVLFGADRDVSTDSLRARARASGIADRCLFAGYCSPPEANIAALDLLIAPAQAEPFGRTLVEALLLGTPYVATADAGHDEIHARWGGGRVVPPQASATEFAEVCAQVLENPDDVRLSPEANHALERELSPAHHAAVVMSIYAGLANQA